MVNSRQTLTAIAIHEDPNIGGVGLSAYLSGWWQNKLALLKESPIGQVITEAEGQADHPDYAKNPVYIRR